MNITNLRLQPALPSILRKTGKLVCVFDYLFVAPLLTRVAPAKTNPCPDDILLIFQYYNTDDSKRQAEINECIESNISLSWAKTVVIFSDTNIIPKSFSKDNVRVHIIAERLTFNQIICWLQDSKDFSKHMAVIANSDIFLPESMSSVFGYMKRNDALAITRFESENSELPFRLSNPLPGSYSDSQDAWVLRPTQELAARIKTWQPIFLGTPGCDNIFAGFLALSGYSVQNPCIDIRIIHNHQSSCRTYEYEQDLLEGLFAYPCTISLAQFATGRRLSPLYHYVRKWG